VPQEISLRKLLPDLAGGIVMGVIAVTLSTAFAALIFSGDLATYVPRGIGLMLVGSMIIASLTALFSSLRGLVAHVQESAAAILALVSAEIVSQMPASATGQERFATVVIAIVLSSLITAVLFLSVGQFKLGNLIRFIPYPVFGGFLAGSGMLLTLGAISVLTGVPQEHLTLPPFFFQIDIFVKLLPGFLFALLLLVALRRRHHALVAPGILAAGIILFYVFLELTNTSIPQAAEQGWLLGALPSSAAGLWQPLSAADFSKVDWSVVSGQMGNLLFVAVVSVIAILLNATGIELATGQDVDLNRDLKASGIANLVAGLTGSAVGYHGTGESALLYKMGARSRLVGFVIAAVCGVVLLLGGPLLTYLPNPILGGLLLFLGFEILATWVYDAWFRLPIIDYFVVIVILITISTIGILQGVGLGVVLGIILFVIDYSRISVAKNTFTGTTFRSNVNRPRQQEQLLRQKGDWLYAVQMQGFIFFGTAQKLLDMIRRRIDDHELLPVRFLILDFRLVTGLDSSAVFGFAKIRQLAEARGITLAFTDLSVGIQRQMEKEVLSKGANQLRTFDDLDHGVEWCEDQVLASSETAELIEKPLTLLKQLERSLPSSVTIVDLMSYFEERRAEKGEILIHQGDDNVGLYFIETGQVTVQREGQAGKTTRLRTMQTGTVVGELGLYLGRKATASVVADEPCKLYYLPTEKLREMERNAPAIASAFHRFIAGILSERLIDTNEALETLTT
jgi:SulP family sulfate permease